MKLSELKAANDRVENGTWVDDIPDLKGVRLKVRGSNSSKQDKAVSEFFRSRKRKSTEMTFDEQDQLTQLVALYCLIEWDGLIDDDTGQMIPFSAETAKQLIRDIPLFRKRVAWAAEQVASQDATYDGEILGNSSPASDGS